MTEERPVVVELTRADLVLVNNALNEVCNGVHLDDAEFQTRLGVTRDEARVVLKRIHELLTSQS